MNIVEITSIEGRKLALSNSDPSDRDGIWSVHAELVTESGSARVKVWELETGLARFFRDLANDWRGFDGTRSYTTLEAGLQIDCMHDGIGHVECVVTLREAAPPTWQFSAWMTLGAAAQMEDISGQIQSLVDDAHG